MTRHYWHNNSNRYEFTGEKRALSLGLAPHIFLGDFEPELNLNPAIETAKYAKYANRYGLWHERNFSHQVNIAFSVIRSAFAFFVWFAVPTALFGLNGFADVGQCFIMRRYLAVATRQGGTGNGEPSSDSTMMISLHVTKI